jgi:phage terminase large subunit-like protein
MGWDFALPDWESRLFKCESLLPDLPLDPDLVRRAVGIFNNLRLPDVADNPKFRDAAGDWQRDIVAALLGSVDAEGFRQVRKLLGLVPKKSNKTTGGAGIMLTALLMDREPRQPYFLYGPSHEIAQLAFDQAAGMIACDPVLKDRFAIRAHIKTIEDLRTNSTLKVQTFDESISTGAKPKGAMVDELHILGKKAYASRVLGQLWGGMVSRPGAFLLMITTQSDEPPAGVFRQELQLARAVRDGKVTGDAAAVLPLLYEFPEAFQTAEGEPWRDPANWPFVLPNLGRSVHLSLLKQQYAEAVEKGPHELARWASQHLNIEIGLGLHSNRWIGADYWLAGAEDGLTLDALLERSEVVTVGIDGGGLDDLFGLAVIGREKETGRWLCWSHAWADREAVARRKGNQARMEDFERADELTICDGGTQDIDEAAELVARINETGLLPAKAAVGLDPLGVAALVNALEKAGLDPAQLVAVGQGYKLSSAIWGIERRLRDGSMVHDGSGLLAWSVGNAKAEQRGNAIYITKEQAGKGKIDPLIALFNAGHLMARPVEPKQRASYELLVI